MPRRIPTHKPVISTVGTEARTRQDDVNALRKRWRWIKCSQAGRKREPLCCDPFGYHGKRIMQAEHRHHIKPLTKRPDLLLDFENHASLCSRCHHRVEAMVRAGKPTEHLFEGEKRAHPLSEATGAPVSPRAGMSDSETRPRSRAPVGPGRSQRRQPQSLPKPEKRGRGGKSLAAENPRAAGSTRKKATPAEKKNPGEFPMKSSGIPRKVIGNSPTNHESSMRSPRAPTDRGAQALDALPLCQTSELALLLNHPDKSLRAAGWNAALDDDPVAGDARFVP